MDESFAFFLKTFGTVRSVQRVEPTYATQYRGHLPDKLLEYWAEHGFAGYGDGLFWLVDPADYKQVLHQLLKGTSFADHDDYHVVARTAFGVLYVYGKKSGVSLQIDAPHGIIFPDRGSAVRVREYGEDFAIQIFLECIHPKATDYYDEKGKQLFSKALKKLGPLEKTEVYGFEPALGLGGMAGLSALRKLQIIPYLEIISQIDTLKTMENPLST